MQEKIEALLTEIEQLKATTVEEVESIRIKYLSKKGIISSLMDEFRNIPADQKREVGMKINALKQAAGDRLQQLKEMFAQNGTTDVRDDLSVWASPSPKVRRWRTTGMYSHRSTLPTTTRHVTCKTPSSFSTTRRWCYVHTPPPYRPG